MFSKISNIFQQAVEVIAPAEPEKDDFAAHWKAITSFFTSTKDHKVCVEQTRLPWHLTCMFEMLQAEDEQETGGGLARTGPCLEYILQHSILETLAALARTDTPPGMRQQVLEFFTKLLSRLDHPLLPHVHVHNPVQRLIRLCGEQRAGPTEEEEIHFLCTVCAKFTSTPYLVNFFIELRDEKTKHAGGAGRRRELPVFPIVHSLIALMDSPDARVAVKACEGLMLVCSLSEASCAQAVTCHTPLCTHLARQLCTLHARLPPALSPHDVEATQAKWGMDVQVAREDSRGFPGKRQLVALLSWLDYCDQLCAVAAPPVARCLAAHVRQDFLDPRMRKALMQTAEAGAVAAVALLTRCLHAVHAQPLLHEFARFILGDEDSEQQVAEQHNSAPLSARLLRNCNHVSQDLSVSTLKLFDALVRKPCALIHQQLVLRHLRTRAYLPADHGAEGEESSDAATCEGEGTASSYGTIPATIDSPKYTAPQTCADRHCTSPQILGASPQTQWQPNSNQTTATSVRGASSSEPLSQHEQHSCQSNSHHQPASQSNSVDPVTVSNHSVNVDAYDSNLQETHNNLGGSIHSQSIERQHSKRNLATRADITGEHHNDSNCTTRADITGEHRNDSNCTTRADITGEHRNDSNCTTRADITGEHHNDSNCTTRADITGEHRNDSNCTTRADITGEHHNDSNCKTRADITGEHHNDSNCTTRADITGEHHNDSNCTTRADITGEHRNDSNCKTSADITQEQLDAYLSELGMEDMQLSRGEAVVNGNVVGATRGRRGGGVSRDVSRQESTDASQPSSADIHLQVKQVLNLLPAEARSSTELGDYDVYLRDAHAMYAEALAQCAEFGWPAEAEGAAERTAAEAEGAGERTAAGADERTAAPFHEGGFLAVLLLRLSRAPVQSYEMNLQLTSVLSHLALLPHPHLHEFLYHQHASRGLMPVLTKVCAEAGARLQQEPALVTQLHALRAGLATYRLDVNSVENGRLLAGIVVLEEFCKELAAILFVKHHHLSTA